MAQIGQDNSKQVPVCLSTIDNVAESVDYFLTRANEPISNFLSLNQPLRLKLCYASQAEIKLEQSVEQSKSWLAKIQDFDFIKTLGKGGFATVYMGKFFSN